MSPALRRLCQGTGAAALLLAGGLLLLPALGLRFGGGPGAPGGPGGPPVAEGAPAELPDLGPAPAFVLTDQDGEPFDSAALAGRPWVVDFVFTRCPAICPVLSRSMARVQRATEAVAGRTRLVSISVDPEHDTPEVLRAYAGRHGADTARWSFLTGDRQETWSLIREGFKLVVAENPSDPANPIAHTPKLVLVDGDGRVRGYYDGTIPDEVEALTRDLTRLAAG